MNQRKEHIVPAYTSCLAAATGAVDLVAADGVSMARKNKAFSIPEFIHNSSYEIHRLNKINKWRNPKQNKMKHN